MLPILQLIGKRTLYTLLGPKMRYLGTNINILSLEAMKNMFKISTTNLKMAQERGDHKDDPLPCRLNTDTITLHSNIKPIVCSITPDSIK